MTPAELERRLRALEDERDVLRTLVQYGHSIDYGRHDEWLDCFTDDAVLEVWLLEESRGRREGRAALREWIEAHTAAPAAYHKHMLVEPRIEVDGDTATAVSYFTRLDEEGDVPVVHSFGRYRDRLVRCPDGRWRFTLRSIRLEAFDAGGLPLNEA